MKVRPAAVAGSFYPRDPGQLRSMIEGFLASTNGNDRSGLRAMIVPHAGYVYSGGMAGNGYCLLQHLADKVKHVVVLGPTHRVGIRGIALEEAEGLATPLGIVPVWEQGAELAGGQSSVVRSSHVHAREHSIEVQLPFLQMVLPEADVLPLAVGWVEPQIVADVIGALWGCPDVFFVISSDLSHYHPYAEAQRIDCATLQQILNREADIDHDQACGATGVNAISLVAREFDVDPVLLGLCNSGNTAGDKEGVVGYTSIGYYSEVGV